MSTQETAAHDGVLKLRPAVWNAHRELGGQGVALVRSVAVDDCAHTFRSTRFDGTFYQASCDNCAAVGQAMLSDEHARRVFIAAFRPQLIRPYHGFTAPRIYNWQGRHWVIVGSHEIGTRYCVGRVINIVELTVEMCDGGEKRRRQVLRSEFWRDAVPGALRFPARDGCATCGEVATHTDGTSRWCGEHVPQPALNDIMDSVWEEAP